MGLLVGADEITQFLVRISLSDEWLWTHDQHSIDQFVAVPADKLLWPQRIELLGRHQEPR